ncbi:prepilin-type N-terminal cleavage/methylation domain-containing protein [Huintestinicola sp.]|uniref:prepilin-type N-terminal cleavage/methylation domain-containing protein n=1 Tax=Huintestinicola sp. TaxID=2981661 RepID=UPI003D7D8BCB
MKKGGLKGFTLIEIIVVIAIIGALAAIIVPSLIGYTRQAKAAVITGNARNVYNAAKMTVAECYDEVMIHPNEIYIGDDSGTAHAVGGSDDLSVGMFMGDDFEGHYAFVISDDGNDVIYAVWSNNNPISPQEARIYTLDEIEQDVTGKGIGSYPNS